MKATALRAGRGLRWYLRQVTGEAKWDEYLDECREQHAQPMSRREFERRRAHHREAHPRASCC